MSAKCPSCDTELTPDTVIVSETQESVKTYSCRRCGGSLKADKAKREWSFRNGQILGAKFSILLTCSWRISTYHQM